MTITPEQLEKWAAKCQCEHCDGLRQAAAALRQRDAVVVEMQRVLDRISKCSPGNPYFADHVEEALASLRVADNGTRRAIARAANTRWD